MWELYSKYYKVCPESFFSRFDQNDKYALYTCNEKIVGFTGYRLKRVNTESGSYQTLYIGQTVMEKTYRDRSLVAITSCKLLVSCLLKNLFQPVYVWCDALTYKPYLLIANSVERFYPSRKETTIPQKIKTLMNHLGQHYYGDYYSSNADTVRKTTNIITDPSTIISEVGHRNADINFFAKANPGYKDENGLLVLTPIDLSNFLFLLKKCGKKMLQGFQSVITPKEKGNTGEYLPTFQSSY